MIKKCIICEKEYRIGKASDKTGNLKVRQGNAITCSPACSKVYLRIRGRILNKMRYKIDKQKEKKR